MKGSEPWSGHWFMSSMLHISTLDIVCVRVSVCLDLRLHENYNENHSHYNKTRLTVLKVSFYVKRSGLMSYWTIFFFLLISNEWFTFIFYC